MRSLKGIYDGEKVQLLESPEHLKPGKVIVTFIEDDLDTESLRQYSSDEDAFNFWKVAEEDIYQDYVKKK